MQEPDAQLSADDAGVGIDEGLALVGIELAGQTSAQDGFFESVMKGFGVGLAIIRGEGQQPGVIVDEHAQMGGQAFVPNAQRRPR